MKTEVPHRRWGRFAAMAGVLAFLLAAPSSASAADFLAGAVSSFPDNWSVSDGSVPGTVATVSGSGDTLTLEFDLDAKQSLAYAPVAGSDAGGTADVVISNAVFSTAYDHPGVEEVGGIESQAAICVYTNAASGGPLSYYGWAGAYLVDGAETNLVWFALSGPTPVEGATNTVTMSFDYRGDPATVTFKVGGAVLSRASDGAAAIPLATEKDRVTSVSFSGKGSIGELAGESAPGTFLVSFFDEGAGSAAWTTNVAANTAPAYAGPVLAKGPTDQYAYEFAGWTNAASANAVVDLADETIVSPTNYYATYDATLRSYTISWDTDGDGTADDTTTVAYGTVPTHADGSKAADAQYTYTFTGWDTAPVAVTGPATYTAQFEAHEIVVPTLALAKPTLGSTVLTNAQSGAVVRATINPTATVAATNATASVVVAGTNATATFTSLPWNDPVDWMLRSDGAADLPGRFYAKGEAQWFSTNELADISGLAEGMKGVDMSASPSPTGQMVRIQTRLEIPEGAQTSLPTGEDVGAARTGFAVAQIADNGDTAPAFYAFNGASWDRLFGAAPAEGATNDLLMVLDVEASQARYYVDGVALYATNAAGAPVYAIGMKASDEAVVKGIGFANPDGVTAPVVAEYDVPFEAAVGDTPYASAAAGLAAADRTGAQTLHLLTNGVAGSIDLAIGDIVRIDTSKGSFADGSGVVTSAGPGYRVEENPASGTLRTYTVGLVPYAISYELDGGTYDGDSTNRLSYTVETPSFTLNSPSRETYDFVGWTGTGIAGTNASVTIAQGSTGDRAYTSVWTRASASYTVNHFQMGLDGLYPAAPYETETLSGTIDGQTAAAAKTYTGFTAGEVTQAAIAADGSTVVSIQYARDKYGISFTWHDGSVSNDYYYGTPGSSVVPPADPPSYVENGTIYAFTGWPEVSDVTAAAAYAANYGSTAAKAMTISVADAGTGAVQTNWFGSLQAALDSTASASPVATNVVLVADVAETVLVTNSVAIDLAGFTLTGDVTNAVSAAIGSSAAGGAVAGDLVSEDGTLAVAGGTYGGSLVSTGGAFSVTGGLFAQPVPAEFVGAGLAPTTVPVDGKYTVAIARTVAFDVDGTTNAVVVADGETVAEPDPAPQKDFHTFRAWLLNGSGYVFATPVTADIALVADWTRNGATITAPAVANATVSAATNGVALAGTAGANGATLYAIEAGTAVAVTYTADEGYHVAGSDPVSTTAVLEFAASETADDLAVDTTGVAMALNAYTVTWKNGAETLETDTDVAHGTAPSYDGPEPTQAAVGGTTYAFDGWTGGDVSSPTAAANLPLVTADVVYTAHFAVSGKKVMTISVAGTSTNYFDTVAEAVSAADAGDTVVLLGDIALSSTVEVSKSLTIDLNGNNLAATGCRAIWVKFGDVRITGAGTVSADTPNPPGFTGASSVVRVGDKVSNANAAALLIDTNVVVSSATCYGVTVFGYNDADGNPATADISLDLYGTVSVTSSGDADAAISGQSRGDYLAADIAVHDGAVVASANSAAIYFPGAGTLTVDGGSITGLHGIVARAGDVVVNGGSVTATGTGAGEVLGDSNDIVVPYAAISYTTSRPDVWQHYAPGDGATINGGTIVSAATNAVLVLGENEGAIVVSGGEFSSPVPEAFCAEGFIPAAEANGQGRYEVERGFRVDFADWDAAPLFATNVPTGETPVYLGAAPVRASSDSTDYAFDGWTNATKSVAADPLPAVSAAAAYGAHYAETPREYAVRFLDEDGTPLFGPTNVAWGVAPVYPGAVPEKQDTAAFSYAFAGWTNATQSAPQQSLPAVVGDVDWVAAYTATPNAYTVTWLDWDGSQLERDEGVAYDAVPSYDGAAPQRASSESTDYAFDGWTNAAVAQATEAGELPRVAADAVYGAHYAESPREYAVRFLDEDGTPLFGPTNVAWGVAPVYLGAAPEKQDTAAFSYAFAGWTNATQTTPQQSLPAVAGAVDWVAAYTATPVTYTVTWLDWDGSQLERDEGVAYDAVPSYDGAAPQRASSESTDYAFDGWTNAAVAQATEAGELPRVAADAAYGAHYDESPREYAVRFLDEDGTPLFGPTNVAWGVAPVYSGAAPEKQDTAAFSYAFAGWTNATQTTPQQSLPAVAGAVDWVAAYTATPVTYTVTWLDWDGSQLERDEGVAYDAVPSYDGAAPRREPTDTTVYAFDGWTNAAVAQAAAAASLPRVEADAAYAAHYVESNRLYAIDFRTEDGSASLFSTNLEWQAAVAYEGAEPSKQATDAQTFSFAGWTNATKSVASDPLPAVSGDATYWAAFDATDNTYEVILEADGETFYSTNIVHGGTVVYDRHNPAHEEEGRVFQFVGWSNDGGATAVDPIGPVTAGGTWTAVFEEIDPLAKIVYASDSYEEYMDTLAGAVARAGAGDKVVLLADAAGAGFEVDEAITLDLGGHLYEIASYDDPVYVTAEGAVVTNGALAASASLALEVAGSATVADLAVTNDWDYLDEDPWNGAILVTGSATLSGVRAYSEYGIAIGFAPVDGGSRLDGSNVVARTEFAPALYALGPVSFADSDFANDDAEFELPAVWIEEGGSAVLADVRATGNTGSAIASSGPVVLDGGAYLSTNAPYQNAIFMQTAAATLAATNADVLATGGYPAISTVSSFSLSGGVVENWASGEAIAAAGAAATGTIDGTEAYVLGGAADALRLENGAFAAIEDCTLWSLGGSAIGVYGGAGAFVSSGDEEGGTGDYSSAEDVAVYAEGAGSRVEIDGGLFLSPEGTNPLKALAGATIEVSGGWFTAEVPEGCLARGYAASPAWPYATPYANTPYTVYIYRDISWAVFTVDPVAFVYDGTAHAPEIRAVFTDDEGETETLHVPGDYVLALPEGRVNAGEYAIAITGTNSWYGTTNLVFSITNRPLSIVALDVQKKYGEADPALLFTTNGLVDGDVLEGALVRAAGENVGTYAITQGTLRASANYDLSFTDATFTIDPARIVPPAAPASVVYDGTEKVPGIETSADWTLDGTNGLVNAGEYAIGVSLADPDNHTWTDGSTTNLTYRFAIAKAQVAPPAEPASAVYTNATLFADIPASDDYVVSGNDGWIPAGRYPITVSLADPGNHTWTDGSTTNLTRWFAIEKAKVAKPAAPAPATYSAETQFAGIPESDDYDVSGDDGLRDVGSLEIRVSLVDAANHMWTDGSTDDLEFPFEIVRAALTATADDIEVALGTEPADVVYTVSYVGFLGDDTAATALDPAPAVWAPGYTRDADPNDTFDLVFTNLGASVNYAITCVSNGHRLVVEPTPVTLTFDPNGGADVDLSGMDDGTTNIVIGVNEVTAPYLTPIDPTIASSREGWVFAGWEPALPANMPKFAATLVAQWAEAGAMVISVADGATSTNWCLSLRDAVANAPAGSTVVLLADDRTSFADADDGAIAIDKDLVIDGAGYTVYGQTFVGPGNVGSPAEISAATAHGLYIAGGDVTIRNVGLTEFGDTDYLNKFGRVPVLTSTDYAGDLVLENVDIDKFNRQAVCAFGSGTLSISGGTIAANATTIGQDYFQQAVEVRGTTVATIDGVTITGGGSNLPYPAGAIVAFPGTTVTVDDADIDYTGHGVWSDAAEVSITGDATSIAATEDAVFAEEGGVATVAAGDFAGDLAVDADANSAIVVNGGTFDRQVPEAFAGEDLVPTTVADATGRYTVKPPRTVSFVAKPDESGMPEPFDVAETDPAAIPEQKPSKEGYLFRAWQLGGADYDWSAPVMEDIELTAAWSPAPYPLVIRYIVPAGAAQPPVYSNDWAYGAQYSVPSPAVAGCTPRRRLVSGTMPIGGVEIEVGYIGGLSLCAFEVEDAEYDGTPRTPGLVVRDAAGAELVAGRDYMVSVPGESVDVGQDYPFAVTGLGSWSGTTNLVFAIVPAVVPVPVFEALVYTGAVQSPENDGDGLWEIEVADDGKDVGAYGATVRLADGLNYRWPDGSAAPTNLVWSIVPAPLTITASDLEVGHGTDPAAVAYGYEAEGFVGGEGLATLGPNAKVTSGYVRTAAVGDTFEIYLDGVENAGNYDLAVVTGTLAVVSRTFAVRFVGDDGTEVFSEDYEYGTPADEVAAPRGPEKPADAQFVYAFRDWTPEVTDVVSNATYTAAYDTEPTVAAVAAADGVTTNYFASIAAAFGAAEDDETIVLLASVSEPAVAIGKAVWLDLNGRTWTVSSGTNEVTGAIALVDRSANGGGSVAGTFIASGAGVELVVDDDATVAGDVIAEAGALVLAYGSVDGDVTSTGEDSLVLALDGVFVAGDVVAADGGEVYVSGGTFDGTLSAEDGGVIEISGGSFLDDPAPYIDPATRAVVPNPSTGYNDVLARRDLSGATIGVAQGMAYTGVAQAIVTGVSVNGTNLYAGTNYVVVCEDAVNAGTRTVTIVGTNLWVGTATAEFTIDPATLTATATNVAVAAGTVPDAVPYGVAITGFVNGEDETALASIPVATNAAYTAATPAGEYAIAVSGGEAANYAFLYVPGTLTVVSAELPRVDPGTGFQAGVDDGVPPAAVEQGCFVVRFRKPADGLVYELVATGDLGISDDQWRGVDPTDPKNAVVVDTADPGIPAGDIVELKASTEDATVRFFKIRVRQ